jgi:cold shock CspA family protein
MTMHGEVVLFKKPEDWGIIHGQDGEQYRVFRDDIEEGAELLARGDKVRFDVQQTEQGPKAVSVCRVRESQ